MFPLSNLAASSPGWGGDAAAGHEVCPRAEDRARVVPGPGWQPSVVVGPTAHRVAGHAQQGEDQSDHHEDDPDGPQDRDPEQKPEDQADDAQNDHVSPLSDGWLAMAKQ